MKFCAFLHKDAKCKEIFALYCSFVTDKLIFMKNGLLALFVFLIPLFSLAQKKEKTSIEVIHADEWSFDKDVGEDITIIRGNAVFKHDSAFLHCDSAYLNEKANNLDAFSNVHVIDNDTIHMWGDRLHYEGNSRTAVMYGDVKLKDPTTELYTDKLFYDRNNGSSYYTTGGEIFNGDNILTSIYGYYFTEEDMLFFKDSVVVTNPDYVMKGDTLRYNTKTEVVYFQGPTTLVSEENNMYCENGFYDTKNEFAQFKENIIIYYDEQILKADSIYYNKAIEYGEAFRNVVMTDTSQNLEVHGHYAEYHRNDGFSFVTDSALAMMYEDSDTLFLHADTLKTCFNDSTRQAEQLFAWFNTKFYRNDIQGMCDSLSYNFADSIISLFNDPVLWSEENQLTADTIFIYSSNNQISRMRLSNAAFIISIDDTLQFNQIQGRDMTALFTDNELRTVLVDGNARTIYYLRDEDESLVGINKAESSNMKIWVEDNELKRIAYMQQPHAPLYPPDKLAPGERTLKGFKWLDSDRPANRHDIFVRITEEIQTPVSESDVIPPEPAISDTTRR